MLMTTTRRFTARSGGRGDLLPGSGAVLLEVAARLELARKRVADHALRELAGLDHRVQVDAGADAQLLAEEDQVLRSDVARGALVGRERAAAHPEHGPERERLAEAR